MGDVTALSVMLGIILSDEKLVKSIAKTLEKYKQVREVYPIKVDDANVNAFVEGNKTEISKIIREVESTPGVRKVEAKIMNPL